MLGCYVFDAFTDVTTYTLGGATTAGYCWIWCTSVTEFGNLDGIIFDVETGGATVVYVVCDDIDVVD